MGTFARILDLGRGIPNLAHRHGVIKAEELQLVGQARTIVAEAQQEAEKIIRAAEQRAEAILLLQQQETERMREEILRQAETSIWKEAADYQNAVEAQFQSFVGAMEEQTLPIVRKAITTLAHELPAEQRIRACIKALLSEVGRPADCVLFVNENDLAAIASIAPMLEWPVKSDPDIALGTCKLIAHQGGEWSSSFAGRLERLLSVFDRSCVAAGEQEVE